MPSSDNILYFTQIQKTGCLLARPKNFLYIRQRPPASISLLKYRTQRPLWNDFIVIPRRTFHGGSIAQDLRQEVVSSPLLELLAAPPLLENKAYEGLCLLHHWCPVYRTASAVWKEAGGRVAEQKPMCRLKGINSEAPSARSGREQVLDWEWCPPFSGSSHVLFSFALVLFLRTVFLPSSLWPFWAKVWKLYREENWEWGCFKSERQDPQQTLHYGWLCFTFNPFL